MGKFLLGALVVFLYYNQANVRRGYYIGVREWNRISAEKPNNYRALKSEAPALAVQVEVQEPTLDDMSALGFKVKK